MTHQFKPPAMTIGPFFTSSPQNVSPKAWYPPQPRCIRNGTPPQGSRNSYYNQCPSPNAYWGSPRQWSPNRWEPVPYFHRSWGSSPRTPHISQFKHSPQHASVYGERKYEKTQVPFKQRRGYTKDISHYYSPSMVEDPWAELQAKDTKSTPRNSAGVCHSGIAGSKAPFV